MEKYYLVFRGLGYGPDDPSLALATYSSYASDITLNFNWLKANSAMYLCNGMTSMQNLNIDFSMGTGPRFSFAHAFKDCWNLINLDVSQWKMNNVISLESTFSQCSNLKNLDVANWNVSNVLNLTNTFAWCSNLTNLNVLQWDTRNVYLTDYMFSGCENLSTLNLSNWNLCNLTRVNGMFNFCSNLLTLNLSNCNLCNVTFLNRMFYNCCNLKDLYLNNCNLINLVSAQNCFNELSDDCNIWIPSWRVKNVFLHDPSIEYVTNLKSLYNLDWDIIHNYNVMNAKTWTFNINYDGLLVEDHANNFSISVTPLQSSIYTANSILDKNNHCISVTMTGINDSGNENMMITLEDDENNSITQDIEINAMPFSVGEYTVTKPSTSTYGFIYNSNTGYYEPENKGQAYTYAKAIIKFKTYTGKLIIKCINQSNRTSNVYGVVSNIDCSLYNNYSSTDSSSNVKKTFKGGPSSTSPTTIIYDNLEENKEYTIEVKFVWYGSTSYSGTFDFQVGFEQ